MNNSDFSFQPTSVLARNPKENSKEKNLSTTDKLSPFTSFNSVTNKVPKGNRLIFDLSMKAAILTIGDEILIGQTVNTNATYIGHQLHRVGIDVERNLTIKDQEVEIVSAVDELMQVTDLIIVTGGLGPTNDDITKETLTSYFGDELIMNEEVLQKLEDWFSKADRNMLDVHRQQAMLPANAKILINSLGTASGMWWEKDGKSLISLPGIPYEMKQLMLDLLPQFEKEFHLQSYYQRTIHFQGIVESKLADENSELEEQLRSAGIGFAYLPSPGIVRIRLSGPPDQSVKINDSIIALKEKYPKHCFGLDETNLATAIGQLLLKRKQTVGTVESCTAGALAARFCSISGSSTYFMGGIVSYDNRIKIEQAGVDSSLIEQHGAVSQEVVEAMAIGGRERLKTDFVISTSGVAGPTGGTPDKPVGTVWIGIATPSAVYSKRFHFRHNRARNIESTIVFGMNFLRRVILGLESPS